MSKEQIVAEAKASFITGQDTVLTQVLSDVADKSAMEQKASDGTLSQGDLDTAVAAAVEPLNQQISDLTAKDAADIAAGQQALADLQAKFDQMSSDKKVEDGVIAGLQSAKDQLAAVLASLSAIGAPQPDPAPEAPAQ